MKKVISLLAIAAIFVMSSCGGSKNDAPKIPGMMTLDLTSRGRALLIDVPDSTKGILEAQTTSFGATEIKVGKEFGVLIKDGEGNIALKKEDLNGDPVRKLIKLHIDEPSTLLYETQIEGMKPVFRFYTVIKIGENSYEVEDIESGEGYSEKAIRAMLESVKNIRVAEKQTN